ncbi:hypothetical protein OG840_23545 [Streptomyces sp. NBC_01764]|uniref:hypothetical protein n=1 Tax=Streptomyces sp. NBC_01764 TaxID=2975935 RepID=UPI00225AE153|nr:hypothetical protein [Streptomyces sp. NBC_01764]MCX4404558.1 hypothetical protein [Streptomyces sp. NBC_01764]
MSAGWVAGAVRAKALVGRYPGAAGAREVATCDRLEDALRCLPATPYSRYARTAVGLPEAQRAVTATLLWHLRVLAGWLPRGGARLLVPPAAGFEIANVASPHRTVVARRARSRTGSGRWRLPGGAWNVPGRPRNCERRSPPRPGAIRVVTLRGPWSRACGWPPCGAPPSPYLPRAAGPRGAPFC